MEDKDDQPLAAPPSSAPRPRAAIPPERSNPLLPAPFHKFSFAPPSTISDPPPESIVSFKSLQQYSSPLARQTQTSSQTDDFTHQAGNPAFPRGQETIRPASSPPASKLHIHSIHRKVSQSLRVIVIREQFALSIYLCNALRHVESCFSIRHARELYDIVCELIERNEALRQAIWDPDLDAEQLEYEARQPQSDGRIRAREKELDVRGDLNLLRRRNFLRRPLSLFGSRPPGDYLAGHRRNLALKFRAVFGEHRRGLAPEEEEEEKEEEWSVVSSAESRDWEELEYAAPRLPRSESPEQGQPVLQREPERAIWEKVEAQHQRQQSRSLYGDPPGDEGAISAAGALISLSNDPAQPTLGEGDHLAHDHAPASDRPIPDAAAQAQAEVGTTGRHVEAEILPTANNPYEKVTTDAEAQAAAPSLPPPSHHPPPSPPDSPPHTTTPPPHHH